jgi:hypothetical protein
MPPWLQDVTKGSQKRGSLDARTFVDYPEDWVTRWQHPSRIQTDGYRDWLPMMASHPAVKVKVRQMVDAGNNIRMGLNGPILTFMPRQWWDAKQAMKRRDMLRRTVGAVDQKMDAFNEDVARGRYGPHVRPYDAKHRGSFPRDPTFDGKVVREMDPH